jgi:hypothetical protein
MGIASAPQLAREVEEYLALHPAAAVLEDGHVLFEMRSARYAVGEQHGRCLLQLWSEERNLIRTVIETQQRTHCLRLTTRRMGAPKPQALELVPSSDRRPPTVRESARRNYRRLVERALGRAFPGAKVDGLRSAMDLEHSFGPAYVRGRLLQGSAAEAVIAVGEAESAATVDGVLTLGILWLDLCRQHAEARRHYAGLKVIVPAGAWRTTAERMAWLNPALAGFQLFTLDERSEELLAVDYRDIGNLESRLVHAFSAPATIERCREGIGPLVQAAPPGMRTHIELYAKSATEVGLRLHGLEFGRVRLGAAAHSFQHALQVSFGAGANETPLTAESQELCRNLLLRLFHSRNPNGSHIDALFRLQSERWLEARLRAQIETILPGLRSDSIYSQVPALAAGERGMLDLLTLDQNSRLAIIEVKADEDLHLPLQALDYWIRVKALNEDRQPPAGGSRPLSAFERQGYFPGREVAPRPPRLLLVAPALRIHPANQAVLRALSPLVEWELIALGEDWRRELNVVFRKRSGDAPLHPSGPAINEDRSWPH